MNLNSEKRRIPFRIKFIIVSTILTTVLWIGFDVYRALTTKPIPIVAPEILAPIDPTLDESLLNDLPNRVYLENAPSVVRTNDAIRETEETPATPIPEASAGAEIQEQ